MHILGTHFYTHDLSSTLLKNNEILGAIEEERLSYIKHHPGLETGGTVTYKAAELLLNNNNLSWSNIDLIALADYPPLLYEKNNVLLYQYFKEKELLERKSKVRVFGHHLSHASSAFRVIGKPGLVFSFDNSGDRLSGAVYIGESNGELNLIHEFPDSQSAGLMYTIVASSIFKLGKTGICEGKLMALSPYGSDDYLNKKAKQNNNIIFDFDFNGNEKKESKKVEYICHYSKGQFYINWDAIRYAEKSLAHLDIMDPLKLKFAYLTQKSFEKAIHSCISEYISEYGIGRIYLAGGTALNCKSNGRLLYDNEIKELFVQPAANDAGLSLGAAAQALYEETGKSKINWNDTYLGNKKDSTLVKKYFSQWKLKYDTYTNEDIVDLLLKNKIIGIFKERMEFGPRALGNRSILALPTEQNKKILDNIKIREEWRPYSPIMLENDFKENYNRFLFENAPFMTIAFWPKNSEKIKIENHIDGSARIQTVFRDHHLYPILYKIKKAIGRSTLINTSFNQKGQPIAENIQQAVAMFYSTPLDALIINEFILKKE